MVAPAQTQELVFERTFQVPPAGVYRAFTSATAMREWLCDDALINPREGGPSFLSWNQGFHATIVYTSLKPYEQVAFTWWGRIDPGPTQVEVRLNAVDGGTHMTLKHDGLGRGEVWEQVAHVFRESWESGLENLQSVLETGLDLRLMRRPLLGIHPEPLTPETAARLGVPVKQGTHLVGVVEGLGAQMAGLRKDDVIVSLGGTPVVDYPSMTVALAPHQAGDTVEVVYYRGDERRTAQMTLSRRPVPDVPATPAALNEHLRQMYAELDGELDQLLAGVAEAEAARQPAPDEWSVKQVLAHLIWTERYNQIWLWSAVGGDDNVPWPDNNPTHLAGMLVVYRTLPELAAELKRAEQATAATAAALPESFVGRKATYRRMGQALLSLAEHTREHFGQMREAIAAARQQ